jgi:hypothetical protein
MMHALRQARLSPVLRLFSALALVAAALLLSACATDTVEDRRFGQQLVCHDGTQTLTVSNADSFVHLDHGDSPGPCPED